jgi:hypothetical protein
MITLIAGLALALVVLGALAAVIDWHMRGCVDYTKEARIICRAAFKQDLPRRYVVVVSNATASAQVRKLEREREEAGHPGVILGTCDHAIGCIEIYRDRHRQTGASEIDTLLHEMTHALCGRSFDHGSDFDHIVEAAQQRLWTEA